MSVPLRTKRNFKSLQLPVPNAPTAADSNPVATRLAPPPIAKRVPPPLVENPSFLSPGALDSAVGTGHRSAMHATLSSTLAQLDMAAAADFTLLDADLRNLAELGQGNGGSVMKVEHIPTGMIMAKKIVLIDAKPAVRKQILRELQIMHDCKSEYIVSSYGAFLAEPNICICMEYMDRGSFDSIYKAIGPIDIEVVGKVALSVLEGLTYLYDVHRIIHRDIKPSNILCNSQGAIKLCDFGVSGELINSIAHTFVGTSIYMSPERIQGAEYSVKSDVWSLGISLIELARGRFPFADCASDDDSLSDLDDRDEGGGARAAERGAARRARRRSKGVSLHGGALTMSIIELMHQIVKEPAPRLPEGRVPAAAAEFVDACLLKDPEARRAPKALLTYTWMNAARLSSFDVREWASTL